MKTQPHPSDREVLAGLVERVTYQNAENGFCVIRVKARSHRDLVTVVGHAATMAAGEWITASGDWVNDRTHGQQFRARFLKTSEPTSVEGIEKYLASGMIRGIGPAYAKRLLLAECPQEPLGIGRADTPDHARGEVLLDAFDRRRLRGLEEPGPELLAMGTIVHPVAGGGDPLASRYGGGVPHHGDQVAVAPGFDPNDTKAVVGVLVRDPLDQPRQHLSIGWIGLRLHFDGRLAAKSSRG